MSTILTVNAGSSSLKLAVVKVNQHEQTRLFSFLISNINDNANMRIQCGDGQLLLEAPLGLQDKAEEERHLLALLACLEWLGHHHAEITIDAVGHRVVHGGSEFTAPQSIDQTLLEALDALVPLAPLHQPYNIKLIRACETVLPKTPQVACFDTMFHRTQAAVERMYAIPRKYTELGIQRYGFHGLSYEYILRQLEQDQSSMLPTIVCHLGAGASMCAIKQGVSLASSMGFTATDGLPMATRSGSVDPGVLIYLMRHHHLDVDQLEHLVNQESGMLGVSDISGDMRTLEASDAAHAKEAIDMFAYRIVLEVGRLTAALEGLEQLVFTGGIGENDAYLRHKVLERLGCFGVVFDRELNDSAHGNPPYTISTDSSEVTIKVIATNEEAMLVSHTQNILELD
ncbi:MAG: acetate/propionate family kinase [Pontibacterium sp.]